MDIQMPVMDGYAATRKIREWERELKAQSSKLEAERELKTQGSKPNGMDSEELSASSFEPSARAQRVPIIAMTAHAMAGDEEKSMQAGMNGHVTKPIDPDQLFAALLKWIQPREEATTDRQPEVTLEETDLNQETQAEEELPNFLAGFDLAAGLERLLGNSRLYRKLLLDFGANYQGAAAEIRQALDTDNLESAHSLVHNLKGLAGNLEATQLLSAAIEMEKLVKGPQKKTRSIKELNKKYTNLESTLNQALEAVQTLKSRAEEGVAERTTQEIIAVSPELPEEAARRIRTASEMGDVLEIKSIAAELISRSDEFAPVCDKLIQLADDFDFDGVLNLANELNSSG
jgi:CheY-like chemotaxis protein